MHITNHKVICDVFTKDHLQNIFMEHHFWHKKKINHFDPYNVLLVIASSDYPTGFVVKGYI